jgi:hypothetical protein
MTNSTVPAADTAWTKIDDLSADLSRIETLIQAATIICEDDHTKEIKCVSDVLSCASDQLSAARVELARILELIRPASPGRAALAFYNLPR